MKKRVTFWIFATALLIAISTFAYFNVPPKPTPAVLAASKRLSNAATFSFGGVGIVGETSEQEKCFFEILDSPRSYVVFREVYDDGTPEAKTYAIVGLMQTFVGKRDSRVQEFKNATFNIATQSGCVVSEATAADVFLALEDFDLAAYVEQKIP